MKLTEKEYWESYWEKVCLPLEVRKGDHDLLIDELCLVFDKYLPKDNSLSIMEIGGAPGQYLVYMHKTFGYQVWCMDYSETGCQKARENFAIHGIPINVLKRDIFSDNIDLPLFDIVYSLGFIEHFSDLDFLIGKHLQILKPGGILLIGCPNLLGINKWFRNILAPNSLSMHNLKTMDISTWESFESKENIEIVFKGYVGGFEPSVIKKFEVITPYTFPVRKIAKLLDIMFRKRFKRLRKFNSKYFSGYAIGIYKKPLY